MLQISAMQTQPNINSSRTTAANTPPRGYSASVLRWLTAPKQRATTAAEHALLDLLSRQRELPFETALAVVAEVLYREEIRGGAWAFDLGLAGSRLFNSEARRVLQTGDGELWQIG